MKPLPDLTDEPAMLLRGKRSALREARTETIKAMRDAYTHTESCDWEMLASNASGVKALAERLLDIAQQWDDVNT
jgi:hypothetical protein